jgi:Flp pilus assembly protein TadG
VNARLARMRQRRLAGHASLRAEGERGAALVELSVMLLLLIIIAFGIVEFGSAWNRKLQMETAARAGARVGSSLGNTRLADYGLLQASRSALNDIGLANVDYVVVFNAAASNGARTGSCAANPPVSVSGQCNVYTGSYIQTMSQADFTGTTSCTGTSPDRFWCPTTRQAVQSSGPDYLGVWIRARYVTITGVFHSPFALSSTAVMRLEPK